MLNNISLLSVIATLLLTPAYSSNINNDNDPSQARASVRVVQKANPQKQSVQSASIQLNLNKESSQQIFEKAAQILAMLPAGIDADASSNSPHVTLETFESELNPNLFNDAQLVRLKSNLALTGQRLLSRGQNSVQVVPTHLLLIAKFEGQDNQYFTINNIHQLRRHAGKLTACDLVYACDIMHGGIRVGGTAFLKDLQQDLHKDLSVVNLKHGRFADNPLCHVTLMRWKNIINADTVATFSKTLFHQEGNLANLQFGVDKLALNPMFGGNKAPIIEFNVAKKMAYRNKADWDAEPRAYVSLEQEINSFEVRVKNNNNAPVMQNVVQNVINNNNIPTPAVKRSVVEENVMPQKQAQSNLLDEFKRIEKELNDQEVRYGNGWAENNPLYWRFINLFNQIQGQLELEAQRRVDEQRKQEAQRQLNEQRDLEEALALVRMYEDQAGSDDGYGDEPVSEENWAGAW